MTSQRVFSSSLRPEGGGISISPTLFGERDETNIPVYLRFLGINIEKISKLYGVIKKNIAYRFSIQVIGPMGYVF